MIILQNLHFTSEYLEIKTKFQILKNKFVYQNMLISKIIFINIQQLALLVKHQNINMLHIF